MKKILIAIMVLMLTANCFALEIVRQKNVATVILFPLIDSTITTTLKSSAAGLDSEIDQFSDSGDIPDGFADCTNEATEIGSTGQYYLVLTQGEMNEDYITVQIKSSDALTQVILIRTMVGDVLNTATTDDGGPINVASGVVEANIEQVADDAVTDNGDGRLEVNVEEWKDTAVNEDTAGYPVVTVKDGTGTGEINTASGIVQSELADFVTHGGSAARFELKSLVITNSVGPAISLSPGSSAAGILIRNGLFGIDATGALTGIKAEGLVNGVEIAEIDTLIARLGTPANIDSGGATIADNLKKLADNNGGQDFDSELHSLFALRAQVVTLDTLLDAVSTHAAADVWAVAMENSKSYAEVMRVFAAVLSGKTSIASDEITFVGIDGSTERLKVTVSNGARTSVDTWDGSP